MQQFMEIFFLFAFLCLFKSNYFLLKEKKKFYKKILRSILFG